MKKLSILTLAALGLMFGACDDKLEPAPPQSNPQQPIFEYTGLAAEVNGALATEAEEVLNLDDYVLEGTVPVIKVTELENLPVGAALTLRLEISDTEDFTKTRLLDLTPGTAAETTDIYYADAQAWNEAHEALFGKALEPQTTYYRLPAYITLEGTEYRVSDDNFDNNYYLLTGYKEVAMIAHSYVVEKAYYVFGHNVAANAEKAVVMNHSDKNEYDDPVFNYFFDVPESDSVSIQITDKKGNVWGVGEKEGELVLNGAPIAISEVGPHKLAADMHSLTYVVTTTPKTLFVAAGGAVFNAKTFQLATSDFVTYEGMAYVKDHFKFTGQKGWKPLAWGAKEDETPAGAFVETENTSGDWIPYLDAEGKTEKEGLNYFNVNLVNKIFKFTHISTLGLVGTINGWGADPDIEMTHDANWKIWKGTFTAVAGDEWKVRANNDWAVNLGPTSVPNEISAHSGSNFVVSEAGTYEVTVDFSNCEMYTVSIVKK